MIGIFATFLSEPSPSQPCHIKTAAAALGLSVEKLEQLLANCNIRPLDKDHITIRTLDWLRRKLEKIPKIVEESLITIAEAAEIFGENAVTVRKWILRFNLVPSQKVEEGKVRWRVKKQDIEREKQENPFFQQARYSLTEVSEMLKREGVIVCTTTLSRWGSQGLAIITYSPGGEPYLLEDQISRCRELAIEAKCGDRYCHKHS